jgi:hypothetical protein
MSHFSSHLARLSGSCASLGMINNVSVLAVTREHLGVGPMLNSSVVPPHGQDDLGNLKSIFELDHLRESLSFLDTQCASSWVATRGAQLANLALKTVCRLKSGILYPNTSMRVNSSQTRNMLSPRVSSLAVLSM